MVGLKIKAFMDYIKTAFKTFGFAAFGLFACAASAETNLFGGLTDADSTEIKASDGNLDVVLNPNASDPTAEAFFKGNGNMIGSLKTAGTPSSWTISSGTTTIDINQAGEGSFDALTNNGSMSLSNSILEIVNSAGTSAVANINVGDLTIKSVEDAEGTFGYAYLRIKTNANLTGSSLSCLPSGEMNGITISNNSNVVSNVALSLWGGSELKVEAGSTFTQKTSSSLYNGSIGNVGATVTVAGKLIFDTNETVNVGEAKITGELTVTNAAFGIMNGFYNSISGKITAKNLWIGSSWVKLMNGAKVVLAENAAIVLSDGNARLTVNAENAVSRVNGELADICVATGTRGTPNLLVNADNKFNKLILNGDSLKIAITVADGAHLSFKEISVGDNATLTIKDFVEGTIFVEDISGWENIETVALSAVDGNKYSKEDLHWNKGQYIDGTEGFWLSTTVPEPATCALIFGAMAMAFALKRRLGK